MQRPLLTYTLAYILGIILSQVFKTSTIIVLTSILTLAVIIFNRNKELMNFYILIIVILNIANAHAVYKGNVHRSEVLRFADKNVVLKGTFISTLKRDEDSWTFLANISEIDNNKVKKEKVRVNYYSKNIDNLKLNYGQSIQINANIEIPKSKRNPGGFDYRKYLLANNIYALVNAKNVKVDESGVGGGNFFVKLSLSIKDRLSDVIQKSLKGRQAALLEGIVLSKTDNLDETTKNNFSGSGLSHLMAVSGMNVAYIVGPLLYIFKRIRCKEYIASGIITIVLIVFTIITGATPSVIRAVIMSIVVLFGNLIYRKSDILTCMAFSAVLMLLYNPFTLFDIGFQLSYGATLALVLMCTKITKVLKPVPKFLRETIAVTLSAQIGVTPIIIYYFNKLSLISLLSNVLAAPLSGVILILGLLMSILGQIHIFFSDLLAGVNYFLLSTLLVIADKSVMVPFSVIDVPTPSILSILIYYCLILALILLWDKIRAQLNTRNVLTASAVLGISILVINLMFPKKLEVSFIDVGQGDSIFIKTVKDKVVLIDGGNASGKDFDVGGKTIVPFLLDKGIKSIDIIVLSHMDADHVSGISTVLANMDVGCIMVPKSTQFSEIDNKILEEINKKKIKLLFAESVGSVKIDDKTTFDVYCNPMQEDENDQSLVLRLKYKNNSFLFTGDISEDQEKKLLQDKNIECDVLKVAHHGSKSSTCENFLDAISPSAAVISVGEKNKFGHPSEDVLSRLNNRSIKTYRTDISGCVTLSSDGKRISVKTMNGDFRL